MSIFDDVTKSVLGNTKKNKKNKKNNIKNDLVNFYLHKTPKKTQTPSNIQTPIIQNNKQYNSKDAGPTKENSAQTRQPYYNNPFVGPTNYLSKTRQTNQKNTEHIIPFNKEHKIIDYRDVIRKEKVRNLKQDWKSYAKDLFDKAKNPFDDKKLFSFDTLKKTGIVELKTISNVLDISKTFFSKRYEDMSLQEKMVDKDKPYQGFKRQQRQKERSLESIKIRSEKLLDKDFKNKQENKGIKQTFTDSVKQSYAGTKSSVTGKIEALGKSLGIAPLGIDAIKSEKLNDKFRSIIIEHPEWANPRYEMNDPRWYASTAGQLLPSMGASIASSILGGLVAGPTGAIIGAGISTDVLESGSFYNDMLDRGIDPLTASKWQGPVGAINTAIELGLGKVQIRLANKVFGKAESEIFKKGLKEAVYDTIKQTGKTVLEEGTEEALQEFTSNVFTNFMDQNQDLTENMVSSFFAGAFGGLMFGTFEGMVDAIKSGKTDIAVGPDGNLYEVNKQGKLKKTIINVKNFVKNKKEMKKGELNTFVTEDGKVFLKNKFGKIEETNIQDYSNKEFQKLMKRMKEESEKIESNLKQPIEQGNFTPPQINTENLSKDITEEEWNNTYGDFVKQTYSNIDELKKKLNIDGINEEERIKINEKIKDNLDFIDTLDQDYIKRFIEPQMRKDAEEDVQSSGGLDFLDNDMESQYQDFKVILNNPKIRNKKTRELFETGDTVRIRKLLVEKGVLDQWSADRIFYSQKMTDSELYDKFLERIKVEEPHIFDNTQKKKQVYVKKKKKVIEPKTEPKTEPKKNINPITKEYEQPKTNTDNKTGSEQPRSTDISETDKHTGSEQTGTREQPDENDERRNNRQVRNSDGIIRERPTTQLTSEERETELSDEGKGAIPTATGRGVLDEYFTPFEVIKKMWGLANKYGFDGGKVLEPSAGIGRFFEYAPENTELEAVEINIENAQKIKKLFPNATVINNPFESRFVDDYGKKLKYNNNYDLVIGNPPYGIPQRAYYKNLGEEKDIVNIETYFIKRGLDVTKNGGLLIYIMPQSFLRSKTNKGKEAISKIGTLIDAYRLPNGIFKGTNVGTDILVFKKGTQMDSNVLSNNEYFNTHKDKIMGQDGKIKGRFGETDGVLGDIDNISRIPVEDAQKAVIKAPEVPKKVSKFEETNKELVVNEVAPVILPQELHDIINSKETKALAKELDFPKVTFEVFGEALERKYGKDIFKNNKIDFDKLGIKDNFTKDFIGNSIEDLYEYAKEIKKQEPIKEEIQKEPQKEKPIHLKIRELKTDDERFTLYTQVDGSLDTNKLPADLKAKAMYMKGKYYSPFNYFQGEIYEKLDQLERDKNQIDSELYNKQKKGLEDIIPKKIHIKDIEVSPNATFMRDVKIRENTLYEKFIEYLNELPRQAFGSSDLFEVTRYLNGQRVYNTGDKKLNQKVKNRRRKYANKLFYSFINDLSKIDKQIITDKYNRNFNGYIKPNTKKIPIISNISKTFKKKKLVLREYQKSAIGFLVNKGVGLLAHDVGAGKTVSSIVAINEVMARGWAKRPLIIVPNQVYDKWKSEIEDVLPGVKINDLSNLGVNVTAPNIEDNTITIGTYQSLNKMTLNDLELDDIISKLKNDLSFSGTKSRRGLEAERERIKAIKAIINRGAEYKFSDFGFDHITIDEAHNSKNIFSNAKVEGKVNEYSNVKGTSSVRGLKTYFFAQHVLKNNNNRNVFGLSATPFTNNPLEIYNIISLMGLYKMEKLGITNINEFMSLFMDMKSKLTLKVNGQLKEEDVIENFKNLQALQSLVKEFIQFVGPDEIGNTKPNKERIKAHIGMSDLQIEYTEKALEDYDSSNKWNKGGELTSKLQNITLTPYMSIYYSGKIPNYKEFVDNSPKIKYTLEHVGEMVAESKRRQTPIGQVIYMDRGVEYFNLMKEYLVKEKGLKDSEIVFIKGGVSVDKKYKIANDFNNGKYKVIIGSSSMKEGIDLQDNATDLYYLHLPWNPSDIIQAEGRIHRFGNKWSNVRIHFPLLENSIDSFLFQKLETKAKRIQNLWSYKGNVMDVSDIDPEELKIDLIIDPVKRVTMEKQFKMQIINNDLETLQSEKAIKTKSLDKLKEVEDKIAEIKDSLDIEKKSSNPVEWRIESLQSKLEKQDAVRLRMIKQMSGVSGESINIEELRGLTSEFDKQIELKEKEKAQLEKEFEEKMEKAKTEDKKSLASDRNYKEVINEYVKKIKKSHNEFLGNTKGNTKETTKGKVKRVAPGSAGGDIFGEQESRKIGGFTIVPELVQFTKTIMGNYPKLNTRLKTVLGRAIGSHTIELKPSIFKDVNLLAKVLAHEIGHIIHNLPPVIKPSTLFNKLTIINTVYKGIGFTKKEITEELKILSYLWRPISDTTDMKYRNSSAELYADFISVLFNNPELAKENAPIFYEKWHSYIENKPQVKRAYLDIQKIFHGDDVFIFNNREMILDEANLTTKEADIQLISKMYERNVLKEWKMGSYIRRKLSNKHIVIYKKYKELVKKGIKVSPEKRPDLALEDLDFLTNELIKYAPRVIEIENEYKKGGATDEELSNYMFYKRIAKGNRKGKANMFGTTEEDAVKTMEMYQSTWSEEKYQAVENASEMVKKMVKENILFGYENDLFTEETFDELYNSDDFYVTFEPTSHLEDLVDDKIYQQIGHLGAINNTFESTISKMLAVKIASIKNKTRLINVEFLKKYYSDEQIDGTFTTEVTTSGRHIRTLNYGPRGTGTVKYKKKGLTQALHTDPYIARSLNWSTRFENDLALSGLKLINDKIFRKMYIEYSINFAIRNPVRDTSSAYKALMLKDLQGTGKFKVSLPKLLLTEKQVYKDAYSFAKGDINNTSEIIQEMIDKNIINMETDLNLSDEELNDASAVDRAYLKKKIKLKQDIKKSKNPLKIAGEKIRIISMTNEAITKVATYKIIKEELLKRGVKDVDKATSGYIRNYIGTPNYRMGGEWTNATNKIWMFSNIAIRGFERSIELATDPNTRAGYWYRKAKVSIIPKLLQFSVLMGLFGDDERDKMRAVSRYNLLNYIVVPIQKLDNGEVYYLRIPQDYDDALVSGLIWLTLMTFTDEGTNKKEWNMLLHSTVPEITNTLQIPVDFGRFAMGKQVTDDFRGRDVFTDTEMGASFSKRLPIMLKHTYNQIFGGIYRVNERPRAKNKKEDNILYRITKIPGISGISGISGYGTIERDRKLNEPFIKEKNDWFIEKNNKVIEYVNKIQDGKDFDEAFDELKNDVYGGTDDIYNKQKVTALRKRLLKEIAKVTDNNNLHRLLYLKDNDEKKIVIKQLKKELSKYKLSEIHDLALKYKLVSQKVWIQAVANN